MKYILVCILLLLIFTFLKKYIFFFHFARKLYFTPLYLTIKNISNNKFDTTISYSKYIVISIMKKIDLSKFNFKNVIMYTKIHKIYDVFKITVFIRH